MLKRFIWDLIFQTNLKYLVEKKVQIIAEKEVVVFPVVCCAACWVQGVFPVKPENKKLVAY